MQVFRHLQKIMICLSYDATLNMMDVIAEGFDQDVLGWKEMLLSRVKLLQSQVNTLHTCNLLKNL